ncbi:hypothetical protein BHAOGJBA_4494 [Methylobacterium hispanicum]|uniref:Uncharacterized protein n=1 Tax=Methylobacterium hispanicum TaxID=270350 RepID=A0AAV4ZQZ4_9HYPH|nr:hypothetical protein [Methylobacterium hispanicum]GJD90950.1 hypothetical protein BHAOGJBA_4494 [Methylobacterium hispanicum]
MRKTIIHVLAAALSLQAGAAQALFEPLAIAGGGIVASKLIDQAESRANQVIDRGAQRGDALLSKVGNELRVATRNLEIAIGDQRDKTLKDISPAFQKITDEIDGLIDAANRAPGTAADIAEVANLNLIEFTNRLSFLSRKVDFWISSVSGLSQIHGLDDYKIKIRGVGFGHAPNEEVRTLRVSVNGKELPAGAVTPVGGTDTQVVIPNEMLASLFKENDLAHVPIELTAGITKPRECWHCFVTKPTETKTYSVSLKLLLLPKIAAVVTGAQTLTSKVEGDEEFHTVIPHQTSGCATKRPCPWTERISLANDEIAKRVEHSHAGPGCDFSYPQRFHGAGPDYDIADGGRTVVVYRYADGEQFCSTTHTVRYRKLVDKSEDKLLPSQPISFGKPFSILLDQSNGQCNYRLEAKLSTRKLIYIDSGMSTSTDGYLRRVSSVNEGPRCRVTFELLQPS